MDLICRCYCLRFGKHFDTREYNCKKLANDLQTKLLTMDDVIYMCNKRKEIGCEKNLAQSCCKYNINEIRDKLNKNGLLMYSRYSKSYTQEDFNSILSSLSTDEIIEFMENKCVLTKEMFADIIKAKVNRTYNYNCVINEKLINALILFDHVFDIQEIIKLAKLGYYIPNIDKYGIDYANSQELCNILYNKKHPYKLSCKPDINALIYALSKAHRISDIRKLTDNIKPDIKCLEKACEHIGYKPIIQHIKQIGNLEFNETCKKNLTYVYSIPLYELLYKNDKKEDDEQEGGEPDDDKQEDDKQEDDKQGDDKPVEEPGGVKPVAKKRGGRKKVINN